ncbi:50S ribosomal protein L24 [candidate division WOR-1 bacterium RIFOXYA12_FULL_43_27]|uniref:Large ribosomal subunit protein uL24 n=1 Tax=candidate division WOR-1 bacterium RIFOXYC2_FULL_46_14 TaxID=1802587 RepID=A0A1F4U5V0_UNCSA|nr:MAG: 50S ribosomal protein L24 [candidate division WOR-1 bacterium RIFOXYA12_FULL_43_27]OGC20436.1 MAG: 50S ribosomal protein L24 [candidate division WOR-1 bacterium RIFOXYB2_FULL_46_45]OGC31827.1 MAG: 50S ribosomal protein L24 [candidate division WOR-1 bacterium RIFOXYA2_FULL_46_56]OGC40281.1 MAG: 50S ribosomal protein L24 [candidate division WOR-1 bacterium RIFOXYC2_FULL_46_14]
MKKGDMVIILSGKDKGKKGKILRVLPKKGTAVVEGVNMIKKHQKATQNFKGGIIERPNALRIPKLMLVCPRCHKPARTGKVDGKRVCVKCKEVVDKEK